MVGGAGNDTYVVNSVNDVVYEVAGEGHDTVLSSTSYLLNAQVEDLVLIEGFATHGTGNALHNRIVGNSADNILDGITGADTLVGGLGNDTYYVDDAGDTVTVRSAITDIYDKRGGKLEFVVKDSSVINQHEELVAELRTVLVVRH